MNARPQRSWLEFFGAHVVEIIAVIALAFIVVRIVEPQRDARGIVAREATVVAVLEAIHTAEKTAFAANKRFEWLSKLVAAAPQDSTLSRLRVAKDNPRADVELFAIDGYFITVALDDRETNSGRVFGPDQTRSAAAGQREYQAFAWPIEYAESSEWAYFISKRGYLLGSRNASGLMDGTQDPFPPAVHPLQDVMRAQKEGEDGEWRQFKDLGEILDTGA